MGRALLGVVLVASVAHADPGPVEDHGRWFFVLGIGFGGESRLGDVAPWTADAWTVKVGERLTPKLQLVEMMNVIGPGPFSPDPTATEAQDTFALALRWTVLDDRFFDIVADNVYREKRTSLYVEASAGVNERNRSSVTVGDTTTRPIAALTLGVLGWVRPTWAFGTEFREQIAPYSVGLQRSYQWLLLLQVTN